MNLDMYTGISVTQLRCKLFSTVVCRGALKGGALKGSALKGGALKGGA